MLRPLAAVAVLSLLLHADSLAPTERDFERIEKYRRAIEMIEGLPADEPPTKGAILIALRRSPLVGADLDLNRAREDGRKIEL